VNRRDVAARLAYGALFVLVLPAGLVLWARSAAPMIPLPAIHSAGAGMAILAGGVLLLALGIHGLVQRGGGLPMNAFPPPRLVRSGVFRWVGHPIYLGFSFACAGAAIAAGSAAGLWLVTPTVMLGVAALVWGYERHDLARRFGAAALEPPLLSLPRGGGTATAAERAAVLLWVLGSWLLCYAAVQALGRPPDAFQTALPFERDWPVLPWTELVYASCYLFIPLTLLVVRPAAPLRRFAVQGIIATVVVTICWLTIPVVAANRPFTATGLGGRMLAFEQDYSRGVAAFPAFHVLWALLAAAAWAGYGRAVERPWWGLAGWAWAVAIALSCLTTGAHTLIEVGAAVVLFPFLARYEQCWERLRQVTEGVANSWREWRIGPVRVINHGGWAAAAGAVGFLVTGYFVGRERLWTVWWLGGCVVVGAGLWAQLLEGSSRLLRPFGWYGGLLGAVLATFALGIAGVPVLPLLVGLSLAAPWIQILGRVRCLVQGCCHGSPVTPAIGIRYHHRRSRVTQLADLAGVPVHPAPLYSILGNIVIGVLLLRLHAVGAADALVVGGYLVLSGTARFVEESYRGEPQTPILAGLRSYQWLAIASVLSGAVLTSLGPLAATHAPAPGPWPLAAGTLAMAAIFGFAMGVDFPRSNRRFSRLAAAD
jgi:protein-S-isoprenylcysteine O-methyltransferase Ste14